MSYKSWLPCRGSIKEFDRADRRPAFLGLLVKCR
ncbi:hypothetical protein CGLO_13447 [Colletotrichum gloeosporioides Cg-14]|uniref:Uncharacterized protein n=1 Tax=Colletotrichum gloeosporioides (strain Cg-14) TaxID=1237896 RepID=T0K647_COLGC|nr:hypothetical protein CGLO_13447 [Colletotrichum gloeosporioides Cg-14]